MKQSDRLTQSVGQYVSPSKADHDRAQRIGPQRAVQVNGPDAE